MGPEKIQESNEGIQGFSQAKTGRTRKTHQANLSQKEMFRVQESASVEVLQSKEVPTSRVIICTRRSRKNSNTGQTVNS